MIRFWRILLFILTVSSGKSICVYGENEHFFLELLRYGTDSDIIHTFSSVQEDLGNEVNTKVLKTFSEKHSEKVYLVLVRYVGTARMKDAHEILIKELERESGNDDYREEVISAIGILKVSSALDALDEIYREKATSIRIKKAIISAYGKIGTERVENILLSIATNAQEDTDIRARALLALGDIRSTEASEVLTEILLDTYEEKILRMYAADSLSKIGGDASIETLAKVIDDETHEVAEYAVHGIAEIDSQRGGDILINALRSDYDKVRYYAILGLKKRKYRDAVDILRFKAMHDSNPTIRKEAQEALDEILGKND
jgi:HEAT repeat protein